MNDDEMIQNCFYLIASDCQCENLSDDIVEEIIKEDIRCIIQKIRQMDYDLGIEKIITECKK